MNDKNWTGRHESKDLKIRVASPRGAIKRDTLVPHKGNVTQHVVLYRRTYGSAAHDYRLDVPAHITTYESYEPKSLRTRKVEGRDPPFGWSSARRILRFQICKRHQVVSDIAYLQI